MAITIEQGRSYSVIKKPYSRTYPIQLIEANSFTGESYLLFVSSNQNITLLIQNIIDPETLLCVVTKFPTRNSLGESFQATIKKIDFEKMIDNEYSI